LKVKKMKKFACIALICLIGCAQNKTPDDLDYKLAGRARLVKSLKDPGSLEIITERVVRPGKRGSSVGYEATFRAKNSFGGYSVETFYTE
jgi:hypothetical protein